MSGESVSETPNRSKSIEGAGAELKGYDFGKIIGGGGMADVYEARQVGLDRPVAVKVMKPWLAQDQEFVSRFLREARVCARLVHPNVVQVHDLGYYSGQPCLVMELLEGRTLGDALEEGPMALDDTVAIIQDILRGLSAAHFHGIVHRDIKPGNVFLCDDSTVKVMDFGIAQAAGATHLTNTGVPIGTPEYMSPEQVDGKHVDARSDLYSVGILLYRLLSGAVPFAADTPIAVLLMHVNKPAPDLPLTVPEWLRGITARALAKHPDDRFASAKEMLAAFDVRRFPAMHAPPVVAQGAAQALPGGMGADYQRVPRNGFRVPVWGQGQPHAEAPWAATEPQSVRFAPEPAYLPIGVQSQSNSRRAVIVAATAGSVALLALVAGAALNARNHNSQAGQPAQVLLAQPKPGDVAGSGPQVPLGTYSGDPNVNTASPPVTVGSPTSYTAPLPTPTANGTSGTVPGVGSSAPGTVPSPYGDQGTSPTGPGATGQNPQAPAGTVPSSGYGGAPAPYGSTPSETPPSTPTTPPNSGAQPAVPPSNDWQQQGGQPSQPSVTPQPNADSSGYGGGSSGGTDPYRH